jgi:Ni/Co efflux regulator RcnB
MKHAVTVLIALAAIAGPVSPTLANGPSHCPPGLAKKSPACVPPGLAKKHDDYNHEHSRYRRYDGDDYGDYRRGDRLPDGYRLILVPDDYGLRRYDDGSDYYIVDDVIYRTSRETREIIDLYRAIDAVLN